MTLFREQGFARQSLCRPKDLQTNVCIKWLNSNAMFDVPWPFANQGFADKLQTKVLQTIICRPKDLQTNVGISLCVQSKDLTYEWKCSHAYTLTAFFLLMPAHWLLYVLLRIFQHQTLFFFSSCLHIDCFLYYWNTKQAFTYPLYKGINTNQPFRYL